MPKTVARRELRQRIKAERRIAKERWKAHRRENKQLAADLKAYKAGQNEWEDTYSALSDKQVTRQEHAALAQQVQDLRITGGSTAGKEDSSRWILGAIVGVFGLLVGLSGVIIAAFALLRG